MRRRNECLVVFSTEHRAVDGSYHARVHDLVARLVPSAGNEGTPANDSIDRLCDIRSRFDAARFLSSDMNTIVTCQKFARLILHTIGWRTSSFDLTSLGRFGIIG